MITTACDVGVADRSQLDKHLYRPATSKLGNHRVSLERPSLGFLSYTGTAAVSANDALVKRGRLERMKELKKKKKEKDRD